MANQTVIEQEHVVLNGVDVTAIEQTIDAISHNAAIAEFKFSGQNTWLDGSANRTTFAGFYGALEEQKHPRPFVYDNDEPEVLLGSDRNPNPAEWLLHGMAGCITTTTVYHAAARGIRIDEMSTRLEGDIDLRGFLDMPGAKRPGYTNIRMSVRIKGDADEKTLRELVEFGRQHSPIVNTVTFGTEVDLAVEVA